MKRNGSGFTTSKIAVVGSDFFLKPVLLFCLEKRSGRTRGRFWASERPDRTGYEGLPETWGAVFADIFLKTVFKKIAINIERSRQFRLMKMDNF